MKTKKNELEGEPSSNDSMTTDDLEELQLDDENFVPFSPPGYMKELEEKKLQELEEDDIDTYVGPFPKEKTP
ncbi:MAG: hypothetical protein UU31_C0003G0140 [Candidatus Uhrbacteria bacterium GW2011_GWA2_41_10]|jgi:hypothetical protein|uniref:Uncharacterized protein n=2 Tax=Candidatus Uhriibacteriota TaxID=1752732 RepID=A0A0G0UJE9_9BACT|nr:MAG: hypothetical protein UU31_C0003G0140 [Candidatus Uhrbacteria bacterium GW2011_GWA2_41_10]KKR87616.1 MAG: hypothetical protein UU35_C0002G0117 [Candidatus Uhrbacteria bacterium GW2011_GWC2_41_11]HBO99783.1 hypothetical protein [Candidatus Uhrbacteria bacterium]